MFDAFDSNTHKCMATGVDAFGHSVVERPPKPLRHDDSQDLEKISRKLQETACVVLLEDMNTHKSLTTAAIASVAFFSLFGAQAAHAAQDGNGNQQSESIEVALVAIGFYDAHEEVQDEPPGDDEITEEETAEEDAADDPIAEIGIPDTNNDTNDNEQDDPITEIVTPEPDTDTPIKDTNNDTNDNEQDDPITEIVTPEPEEQDLDEIPNDVTNDIEVNSNDSVVEAASIVETIPDTEVAPSLNVTADDTDHNALPATGMELSLAFLGLGLAGIGGTLLAVRRRLMIK